MTHQQALRVLNAIPGLGSVRIHGLLTHFNTAQAVLAADYEALVASQVVPLSIIENIVHFPKDKFLEDDDKNVQQKNATIITIDNAEYPYLLKKIPGAPIVLYICGEKELLHRAAVAMVGSRVCSYYGKAQAVKFAESFAHASLVVVSGMARGIDTCAHQGCLKVKGHTIAVLGCGLNHVYPKENQALMEQIEQTGAVISELPMGTPAMPANFPRRNRIITGLTLGTVVIEAGEKSGALISAGYALEQGRDVYVVPANIDYETARGSNQLLKEGAQVALDPRDVLEGLSQQVALNFSKEPELKQEIKPTLNSLEAKVCHWITSEPMHIDVLAEKTKMPIGQIAQVVLHLQIKEMIKEIPGKYFIKV